MEHEFDAPLWVHSGGAWRFVTLPHDVADEIDWHAAKGGFGSVKVRATIGRTSWDTSLFPSSAEESYVLPVKASVRKAEAIADGDAVRVRVRLAGGAAMEASAP